RCAHPAERNSARWTAEVVRQAAATDDAAIQLFHDAPSVRVPARDDAIGKEGIVQRVTLTEELGIRDDALRVQSATLQAIARAHGHGGTHQNDRALPRERTDLCRSCLELLEVGTSV